MVQGKLPNNLGIQFNHVKSEKPDPTQPKPSPRKSNYMNPTRTSDDGKDHRTQTSSYSNNNLHGSSSDLKATCSSTLKDSKFPTHLKLNLGANEGRGASVAKVCKYKHCSLNDPPLPPLKVFLKSRRHSLKTQKSVTKIEIHQNDRVVSEASQRSEIIGFEENNEVESDLELGSLRIDVHVDQVVQEVIEEPIQFDDSDLESSSSEESKPCPIDQISDDDDNDHDSAETTCRKWTIGVKKPIGEGEEEKRGVNFREPNCRPLEAEAEAERVELRRQVVEERKDGREWMVDYAMQRAVAGLRPAREKNVAMLVQAFEKVLPKSEARSRLVCLPRKLGKVWVGI